MTAPTMTRRTAVGAGLAFASLACAADVGMFGPTGQRQGQARPIDTLLIDQTIEMPSELVAFIKASAQTIPVVGINLDSTAHDALMRVLDKSRVIVGISSGASLFCLERMAWDHGFRLTERIQRCTSSPEPSSPDYAACQLDVARFLTGAQVAPGASLPLIRAYRPSRVDAMLHSWVMQKSVTPQIRQGRREV